MRFSTILSLLPLALSVAAINVTEPAKGDDVDVSGSFTVKWSSVNTDPSTVDVVLVNNNVYPPVSEKIASGIDTSKGSYTASGLKGVTNGSGFQINLLSTDAQNTGILAQSEKFDVTEAKSSSATTTGTSSTVSSSSTASTSSDATSTASTSTGTSSTETEASTTGTSTPDVSIRPSIPGPLTSGSLTTRLPGKNSTDLSLRTATGSSSTSTETSTSTGTKTSTKTGLTTSVSSTHTATGTGAASATASTGAAMGLVAPGAAAGLLAGILALL
ncbi:Cell wall beta-glucan synthesis [Penicillium italicum]|uniref:Cell wall beta-glucan synthesis n=1 Tax=Penicillium italicum TaxID=40296 RepID=A0A0A2LC03_PENIT|nr:Cell wall beta-glucan synthesis [Penicillium italicum]